MNNAGTDELSWNSLRNGDRTAFAQIYFTNYEALLNYGLRFGLPPEQVEDTIQDLFVELWQYRAGLSQTTSVRFYLLRALRNQLSRHQKAPLFTTIEETALPFSAEFVLEAADADATDNDQQWQMLQRALNTLTPRQREIIYLRFFNGLDYPQIAETMNLSYQAARNQVYLALKAIRERLPVNWRLLLTLTQLAWASARP